MRTTTKLMMGVGLGLCLAAAACSGSDEEENPAAAPAAANADPAAPGASAPSDPSAPAGPSDPSAPSDPNEPAPPADSDAGAPLADAGADASAPKPKIPAPSQGTLVLSTNSSYTCEWSVGGVVKGTSIKLTLQIYPGTYDVACKRTYDAKVISGKAYVVANQTEDVELTFKGKVEAASTIPCTWYFAGFIVGSGTTYSAEHNPGTSSLKCAPSDPSKSAQTQTLSIVADQTTKAGFIF